MSDHPFTRLAPFIQEFIYRKNWDEMRAVQVDAARALFDTKNHVLIMSGTASGKTEAAFLPILTDLHQHPVQGIGVLYIGPLKALINNQFERLKELLEESHIQVQSWHGDVDQSRKQKFLQQPQGVLQITPESLEAMLILRHHELARLFGGLRYIVIDEVHAFMHADRGQQILCQLERLRAVQEVAPRRIGLSATLGDPESATQWLAGNTDFPVTIVNDTHYKRTLELALWHFKGLPDDYEAQQAKAQDSKDTEQITAINKLAADHHAMFRQMFMQTQRKKSIIFTNSRGDTEMVIGGIREVAQQEHAPDIYHVHHGNISAPLRAAAESAMQAEDEPACVAATVTLELGIDIGRLDQVLQLNSTYTVASFVQRLGRAGRRDGQSARMLFYHEEEPKDIKAHPGDQFPWDMLQTIAIIQLYIEEKWIEPGIVRKLPFSLLFHQTLSILTAFTELTPPELAQRILTMPPFRAVSQEQYRTLLRAMLEGRFLERAENGKLIVGLNAEKIINNHHFYAVFPDQEEFIVRDGTHEIGSIQTPPPVDSVFRLAGFAWKALEIDQERHLIKVERASQRAAMVWAGGGGDIHDRVVERVRRVVTETNTYGYLQPSAVERLQTARQITVEYTLGNQSIVSLENKHTLFFPWKGTRIFRTLALMLKHAGYKLSYTRTPYYMEIEGLGVEALKSVLTQLHTAPPTLESLTAQISEMELSSNKFDRYIPIDLRREAYGVDELAYAETVAALGNIQ